MDTKLLSILVCPTDHSPLKLADTGLIARVNRAIAAGCVKNQSGQTVTNPLDGGLVRADGTILYPVLDDIPVLLSSEAIALSQLG